MTPPVEVLVLAGGGARMVGQLGALGSLQRRGRLRAVRRVVGTSAGAVLAAALAIGRDMEDVFLKSVHRRSWAPSIDLAGLATRFGIDSGADLDAWISEVLLGKEWTFGSVFDETGVSLEVCATNVSRGRATYFCRETHPDLRVSSALRASCSLPLFFQSVSIGKDVFVDGGVMDNFPLARGVAGPEPPASVLGVCVAASGSKKKLSTLGGFVAAVADLLASSSSSATDGAEAARVLRVPECSGVPCGVMDFTSTDPDARLRMYLHGARAADEFLAKAKAREAAERPTAC